MMIYLFMGLFHCFFSGKSYILCWDSASWFQSMNKLAASYEAYNSKRLQVEEVTDPKAAHLIIETVSSR